MLPKSRDHKIGKNRHCKFSSAPWCLTAEFLQLEQITSEINFLKSPMLCLKSLKFWRWLLHSQTKTPPCSLVITDTIDFPPFKMPPSYFSCLSPNSFVFILWKACGPVELILLKADNYVEVPLTAMKFVSMFEFFVIQHQGPGALSWVSGRAN